jgi:hypothetical protein
VDYLAVEPEVSDHLGGDDTVPAVDGQEYLPTCCRHPTVCKNVVHLDVNRLIQQSRALRGRQHCAVLSEHGVEVRGQARKHLVEVSAYSSGHQEHCSVGPRLVEGSEDLVGDFVAHRQRSIEIQGNRPEEPHGSTSANN